MGQDKDIGEVRRKGVPSVNEDFVLEKSIFNNIFEKDIRRVYIYKKAERLAKAIHLIAPAFVGSASLRNRIDEISIGLVDAAILPTGPARVALSRELLALSSVLSISRIGGLLSAMNADLIAREAHSLLQEVATYEEPRLSLEEAPTLSGIAKLAHSQVGERSAVPVQRHGLRGISASRNIGHGKDIVETHIKDRREAIMSIIREKGTASIKDISTMIHGVSEKTIQRELLSLISSGSLVKRGERRWSTYSLS